MTKNLEKITNDLYVDWSEYPQNTPVNGSYFEYPTSFIFDNTKEKENKE